MTTVHLGYAVDDFHGLLDSELFLPESWAEDRPRCRVAHIPDAMVYCIVKVARSRLQLSHDHARINGVTFRYLTFGQEGYGGKPEFLRQLAQYSRATAMWPKLLAHVHRLAQRSGT